MTTQTLPTLPETSDHVPMTHFFIAGERKSLCGKRIDHSLGPADSQPVDCVVCAEIVRGWGYDV